MLAEYAISTTKENNFRPDSSSWKVFKLYEKKYLRRIHIDIWQNQYNIVKLKNKIKLKKKKEKKKPKKKKKERNRNLLSVNLNQLNIFLHDGQRVLHSYFLYKVGYSPSFDFPWKTHLELFKGRDLTNRCWTNQFSAYLIFRALKFDSWKLCQEPVEA